MKYKVKKQFNGYVSVRDYIIQKSTKKREPLIIEYLGKIMTIPLNQLQSPYQLHKHIFKSKFTNKEYELIDFKFIPDKEKQLELL
jgi:hypothetical protein